VTLATALYKWGACAQLLYCQIFNKRLRTSNIHFQQY
jgi:hypothetical protein